MGLFHKKSSGFDQFRNARQGQPGNPFSGSAPGRPNIPSGGFSQNTGRRSGLSFPQSYNAKRDIARKNLLFLLRPYLIGLGVLLLLAIVFFIVKGSANRSDKKKLPEMPSVSSQAPVRSSEPEDKTPVSEAVEIPSPVQDADLYYYRSRLSGEMLSCYDAIVEGAVRYDSTMTIPPIPSGEIQGLMNRVTADHPELFWINDAFRYFSYDDRIEIKFDYPRKKDEIDRINAQLAEAVARFKASLDGTESEYEIIRKVYLYIIDNVRYDMGSPDNQNLCSSLINHVSVCAGYSRGAQYLLQQCGIQTVYVSGVAEDNGVMESHAWNIVRCNGSYYQMDATYGDGLTAEGEARQEDDLSVYFYLCIDDDTMYRDHKPDEGMEIPVCSSTDLNYYIQHGIYADTFDDRVLANMENAVAGGQKSWYYQFSNYDAYAACLESVKNGAYRDAIRQYMGTNEETYFTYSDSLYYITCRYD